jgi:glutathione S-transferase
MLKLYYAPNSRAGRVRWALEEHGLTYQLIRVDIDSFPDRRAKLSGVNPLLQVPVLVTEEGDTITESCAACLYLADLYPERTLAPAPAQRARYYQWCLFVSGTLEPPLVEFFINTIKLPLKQRDKARAEQGLQDLKKGLKVLESHLASRTYLLDRFTTADILVGSTLGWISFAQALGDFPRLRDYSQRLSIRPAFQRAMAD